jgi:putative endonuclease
MKESINNPGWCVYALRCRNNYLYIGSTNNLERRIAEHNDGKGSKFVRAWRPFEVSRVIACESGREARSLEYKLKRLKRPKKLQFLGIDCGEVTRRFPLGQNAVDMKAINALINGEMAKRTRNSLIRLRTR